MRSYVSGMLKEAHIQGGGSTYRQHPFHCWMFGMCATADTFLSGIPSFDKTGKKTLAWPWLYFTFAKMDGFEKRGVSHPDGYSRGGRERFWPFWSHLIKRGGQGPGVGRVFNERKRRVVTRRGREVTSVGVGTFPSSLCEGAFCVGIVGRYTPVSSRERVISWGEEASFPPAGRRELLVRRAKLSSPVCTRRLMLGHVEGGYTQGGTGSVYTTRDTQEDI